MHQKKNAVNSVLYTQSNYVIGQRSHFAGLLPLVSGAVLETFLCCEIICLLWTSARRGRIEEGGREEERGGREEGNEEGRRGRRGRGLRREPEGGRGGGRRKREEGRG